MSLALADLIGGKKKDCATEGPGAGSRGNGGKVTW